MRLLLIGNNDGPLRLARAIHRHPVHRVVAVGLQRHTEVLAAALAPYCSLVRATPDEKAVGALADEVEFDWLVNCFANFKYRYLHRRYPSLNVHPTPLPRYRGRHPLQWALINGEREFGISLHQLTDDFDDGPIYWQGLLPVVPGWSAVELREALLLLLEKHWPAFLDGLTAGLAPLPNDAACATYVTRRSPADSILRDWDNRDRLWRKIKALRHDTHPAVLLHGDQQYTISDTELDDRFFVGFQPGKVVGKASGRRAIVCGDGRTLWLIGNFDRASLNINDTIDT